MAKRKPNSTPGGSPRPACDYSQKERGDGHGRPLTKTTFNPDALLGFGIQTESNFTGLRRSFHLPPFSVFRAAEGEWVKRKKAWLALGIKSEIGRGDVETWGNVGLHDYDQSRGPTKQKRLAGLTFQSTGFMAEILEERGGGTSIFDPVLCELAYRWFCPAGGQIIDPFAGGSVRGIVASVLGFQYWGADLRQEQIDANRAQAIRIATDPSPEWVCGDSMRELRKAPEADFIFSCPPYGNLEVYSDIPEDISNMGFEEFLKAYQTIIHRSCQKLKQDRFACFVVGNYRDSNGFYHDLVGETVRAFEAAGAHYYNEAVLVTATGSLPVRITRQFQSGRKLGKTHQNILIFFKGDPKTIKKTFGDLEE